jgi:hypothetical protein
MTTPSVTIVFSEVARVRVADNAFKLEVSGGNVFVWTGSAAADQLRERGGDA